MNDRLTEEQLVKIIAETEQLSKNREENLGLAVGEIRYADRQQVEEILAELNLDPSLLDEAMLQIHRKEALAKENKRNKRVAIAVTFAIISSIALITFFSHTREQALAKVSVYGDRITLERDNGGNLTEVDRNSGSQLYYRVTLQEAPVGQKLSLKCDWIDPSGNIAHQNSYSTRKIDKEVWNTHCRHSLGVTSQTGTWNVKMYLGNRLLDSASFEVK